MNPKISPMTKRILRYAFPPILVFGLVALMANLGSAQQAVVKKVQGSHWVGTWAASAQAIDSPTMPPMPPGLADTTLRQIVHVSLGGTQLRVRFSNAFGGYGNEGLKINT